MNPKNANLYLCVAAVTHRNGKNIHSMSDAVANNPRAFSGFTNRVEITSRLSGLSARLNRDQKILLRESLQELIADLREDNVSDDIKEILMGIPGLESLDEKVIYDLYVSINL